MADLRGAEGAAAFPFPNRGAVATSTAYIWLCAGAMRLFVPRCSISLPLLKVRHCINHALFIAKVYSYTKIGNIYMKKYH